MEMQKIRTVRNGERLLHPCGALATNEGALWPRDQFTARRLRDGDIELVESETEQQVAAPATNEESN